jgi:hypothetical protein
VQDGTELCSLCCIYNFSALQQKMNIFDTMCSSHGMALVMEACRSGGGRAAANASPPLDTTAAAAPDAPGTSGTAAPA